MRLISYPNYHDPCDFAEIHLPEMIERNFDTVLFPVSQEVWDYNLDNVVEMRYLAEVAGLDTWACPWGMFDVFAGEALTTLGPEDIRELEFWKSDMVEAGFQTILLDEPRIDCDPDTLFEWFSTQRKLTPSNIRLTTALSDDVFESLSDEQISSLPVDSLGLSCYHWVNDRTKVIDRTLRWTDRLARLRPEDNHVWIQNFDLPRGHSWIPKLTEELSRLHGISDFAYWSFRGTRSTAAKVCHNWRDVWDSHLDSVEYVS